MGVRQGSVMSPWLFNIYMNGMIEVKAKLGKRDAELKCGREVWWLVTSLFADVIMLITESEE